MRGRRRDERLTIGAALNGHNNSFGALRLAFAGLVIYSHAFDMGGWGIDPTYHATKDQFHLGTFAVFAFLGISGYVVTKSATANDGLQFFWRRILRIFPAFWGVLAVSAFVVGPINWLIHERNLVSYFTADTDGPVGYVTRNWTLFINQRFIAGLFESNPWPDVVNRSLWTLDYEWACYLLIGALAVLGLATRARWLLPAMAVALAAIEIVYMLNPGIRSSVSVIPEINRVRFTMVFLWGATFAAYSKVVPFKNRLAVMAVVVLATSSLVGGFYVVGLPALMYVLIYVAVHLPATVQRVGRANDYSYGLYLYGALVQQIGAAFGWYAWGFWPWTLASLTIALGCAWLSWHLIEKNAMKLRDFGPGRGIRYWVDKRYPAPTRVPADVSSQLS